MFPYMPFFMNLFFKISKWYLPILLCSFFLKNIVNCYNVFPHGFFSIVFLHMFVFKIIFVEFFFNIELVENSALTFSTCFFSIFLPFFSFFCVFFSELFLLILFFLI